MVVVATQKKSKSLALMRCILCFPLIQGAIVLCWFVLIVPEKSTNVLRGNATVTRASTTLADALKGNTALTCPYTKWSDLTESEQYPQASATRHIVTPPADRVVTLVCCDTTAGPLSIAIHHSWAVAGAQRFLDMVQAKYFSPSHPIPLMRCLEKFLCQFGLSGTDRVKEFNSNIPDDPQWLPAGPTHRVNELGVKRFALGYMSYAGGGPNTRGNQLFVTLNDNGPLGGGSPWEVPWGELVGVHSFDTLKKIYTGYGEDGPSQSLLHKPDGAAKTRIEFPKLDWITNCQVVDQVDLGTKK